MLILAGLLGALLLAPHLLSRTQLSPLVGIGMWWSVLAFRVALALCIVLAVLLYLPASQPFDLLTRWCLHAALPFIATHLGFSGHRLADAASLAPAVVLLVSVGAAVAESWRAGRSVRHWLRRSALGPGPENSLIVDDPELIVATVGMRERRVVVSKGALDDLDGAELRAGLQHEWGHVRRAHWVVTLTSSLLLPVSRFLPGGGSAFRHLHFHLERDADRYAVRRTGDPLALASAIAKVATARTRLAQGMVLRLGGGGTADRLRLLLDGDDFRGGRLTRAAGGALTVGALTLTAGLLVAAPVAVGEGLQVAAGASPAASCA